MRLLLAAMLLASCTSLVGCKKSPEELHQLYRAAMTQAIADARPSYELFEKIRANLKKDTPPCTAAPDENLARVSTNRLLVLTGEPATDQGWAKDAQTIEPSGDRENWDKGPQWGLPSPKYFVDFTPYDEKQISQLVEPVREAHAAMKNVPGFLVQRIDELQKGKGTSTGYAPGHIKGQIVWFEKTGEPKCHYPYSGENDPTSVKAYGGGYNGGVQGGLDRDLGASARRSIDAAFAAARAQP